MSDLPVDLDVVKRRFLEAERGLQNMIESLGALKAAEESATQTQQSAALAMQEVETVARATHELVLTLGPLSDQLALLASDKGVTSLRTMPSLVSSLSDQQAKRDAELRSLVQQQHRALQQSLDTSLASMQTTLMEELTHRMQPLSGGLAELRDAVATHISGHFSAIRTVVALNSVVLVVVLVLLLVRT